VLSVVRCWEDEAWERTLGRSFLPRAKGAEDEFDSMTGMRGLGFLRRNGLSQDLRKEFFVKNMHPDPISSQGLFGFYPLRWWFCLVQQKDAGLLIKLVMDFQSSVCRLEKRLISPIIDPESTLISRGTIAIRLPRYRRDASVW
jgi:hypothetical protein